MFRKGKSYGLGALSLNVEAKPGGCTMPQAPGYGATGQVKAMFVVSLSSLIKALDEGSAYIPAKYDPLISTLSLDDPKMHQVYSRLMESLDEDKHKAYDEARLFSYYQLAALELVAKVVLEQPIERLPLGHEALGEAEAGGARAYLALIWAAQFLAYCEGKEPFSIYDENTGARIWSIADDNVKAEDFYNYFKVEA